MDGTKRPNWRPTRRAYLATGFTALGTVLAGCTGDSSGPTTGTDSNANDDTDESYSVSIEPMGTVSFDSVPQTWVANNGSWADMGIALGLEPPKGVWLTDRYHTQYYDAIPAVSVSTEEMVSLYQDGVSKERFYDLDADVHVIDPNFLMNRFKGWEKSDVDEIRTNVSPFFGNSTYAQHYPWHEEYRYYTLYEGFEKLAQVFRRTDRYDAFVNLHDDFQNTLKPIVNERSTRAGAVLWGTGDTPKEFYPYRIGNGTGFKHLRDLGVSDALANSDVSDFHGSRTAVDFETILEVDPEVLLLRGYETKTASEFQNTVVTFLESHPTASELTAVSNGDVYRAGGLYQGPITNMVLTERLGSALFNIQKDLFDRDRVGAIVNGEF
ncbi:ABC transporter substrate-binding protein [Halocatena halophila]|uniref:ABC transporter substrate-binding protein n=1 Tax=Halocatena halophila TaxID=2814576 RepID=UPI002ED0D3E8